MIPEEIFTLHEIDSDAIFWVILFMKRITQKRQPLDYWPISCYSRYNSGPKIGDFSAPPSICMHLLVYGLVN